MNQNLQERWDNRWQEIVVIGSGIDWADINAQLDASLVLEDLEPSAARVLGSPDPSLPWHTAGAAA